MTTYRVHLAILCIWKFSVSQWLVIHHELHDTRVQLHFVQTIFTWWNWRRRSDLQKWDPYRSWSSLANLSISAMQQQIHYFLDPCGTWFMDENIFIIILCRTHWQTLTKLKDSHYFFSSCYTQSQYFGTFALLNLSNTIKDVCSYSVTQVLLLLWSVSVCECVATSKKATTQNHFYLAKSWITCFCPTRFGTSFWVRKSANCPMM